MTAMQELFGDLEEQRIIVPVQPVPHHCVATAAANGGTTTGHNSATTTPPTREQSPLSTAAIDLEAAAVARAQYKSAQLNGFSTAAAPPVPAATSPGSASSASAADLEAEDAAAAAAASKSNNLGFILLLWSSAILAVAIVAGGAVMLAWDPTALTTPEGQCNQLYVWSMLFICFECIYLIFLLLNVFNYKETNFHAKRAKTSILLIVLLMSVGFFIWGTVIINRCTCSEKEHALMWAYFRVLYWFIIGIWSVVLLALTGPVALFLAFKIWTDRQGS